MLLTEEPLTAALAREISDLFEDADLDLIRSVVYFNGWSGYHDYAGILIFRAIDDSLQMADYGSSVMAEDPTQHFFPLRELSEEEAEAEIAAMEKCIEDGPF